MAIGDAHRTIIEVILDLYTRREPADHITICNSLERRKQLVNSANVGSYTLSVKPVRSESMKNSLAQQLETGAAVSHPFEKLQLVHMTLN
ncbi:DnaB-like helicase N-terminal domain-containing protein [Reticulibacter mediterranei]|uniref:DnaB-like helicase N-terminal domain-containing protein n=1 Tax=Reticulibacter mediterranei TaxID=2778369 RepID=UPI001C687367